MSDIFISYANENRPRTQRLAEALAGQGWSIFWDRTIPTGKTWREVIGAELEQARCIVVLWSGASIDSDWVQEEADEGRERGILIPVLIEAVRPPIGFRSLQTANLADWDGTKTTTALQGLITDIAGIIGPPPVEVEHKEQKKAEADAKQRAEEEKKRKAEATSKREAEEEARRKAELEEKTEAVAEMGSVPPAPKPSLWKKVGPAKWSVLAAVTLLLVGGVSYAVYQLILSEIPQPGTTFRDKPKDGSEDPEMVVLPAGSFTMGSPDSDEKASGDEKPQHQVTFSQPFAVGKYEVTFGEWDACVAGGGCDNYRPDDEGWGRGRRPVINVSWDDAKAYVAWLSRETGKAYRLLSEAEWEYAARAGTKTLYSFEDGISEKDANFGVNLGETSDVGSYPANPWELHDMHGNVWEWVEDCWNESYEGAPSDGSAWTSGDCSTRGKRGGSWFSNPEVLRSASRGILNAGYRDWSDGGFRVARTLP